MRKQYFRESAGAVSSPINLVTVEGGEADWIQAVAGGAIAWRDGTGTATGVAAAGAGDVFPGPIREVTSSAGKVRYGTGPLPIPGPTGAAGLSASNAAASAAAGGGIQKDFSADGAASTATAETFVGAIFGPCSVEPRISSRGVVTASDTTYATFTFKLYRAGAAVKTWTITTKTSGASLGTGSWIDGSILGPVTADPYAAVAGDYVTVSVAKASTGVQLPAHACGAKITA